MFKNTTNGKDTFRVSSNNIPKLYNERVKLCILRSDEQTIRLLGKWSNASDVSAFLGCNGYVVTDRMIRDWVDNIINDCSTTQYFTIVEAKSDNIIGICGIEIKKGSRNGSLSILIGDEDQRGKGFGAEALKTLITYAFLNINLHTLSLSVLATNQHAIRCYTALGFKQSGISREYAYIDGKYIDVIHMDFLKSDFEI